MSSPDSIETNLVRCIKCGKILKCSRYDTAALLDHIRTDHPEVEIIDTDTKQKRRFVRPPGRTTPKRNSSQADKINNFENLDLENPEGEGRPDFESPRQAQYVKDVDLSHYSATSEILKKYPEIKECEYVPHNPDAQVAYTRRYMLSTPSPASLSLLQQPFQHNLYRTSIEKWCPANGSLFCPKCGSNKRPLIKTKAERFTYNECGACCLLSCWPFCFIPWILPGQNQEYLYCANCKTFLGLYDRDMNCIKPNRLYISSGKNDDKEGNREQGNLDSAKESQMLENESPPQSLVGDKTKSTRLSSIIVNGKELPPDTVARIEKYKRFSSLVGIDLNALNKTTDSDNAAHTQGTQKENERPAPSAVKPTKTSGEKL